MIGLEVAGWKSDFRSIAQGATTKKFRWREKVQFAQDPPSPQAVKTPILRFPGKPVYFWE